MNKRVFLQKLGLCAMSIPALGFKPAPYEYATFELEQPTDKDEKFWAKVRADYQLKPDYINLENGYYCMLPQPTLELYLKEIREVNRQASWYFRYMQATKKDEVIAQLVEAFGGSADELTITRNTTESLDTIISGYPWKEGDEVVYAHQDYGSIKNMLELVSRRYKLVQKIVDVPMHPKSDEDILEVYANAITPKTRLVMVSHMINITGQILPVKKLANLAHQKGAEILVDGAHCIGHFTFKIDDLDCDYYASSLHKWLSAPLGSGLLYVKKEHIKKIWPLLAPYELDQKNIKNLGHTGTHPAATDLAIKHALKYYQYLGPEPKEHRLRYLKNYWTSKIKNHPKIQIHTPEEAARSCAIANVGIVGIKPDDLAKTLLNRYKIYTVAIDYAGVHGVRVTPNVYTSTGDLDKLVTALQEIAAS